jgi:hypothetical protein
VDVGRRKKISKNIKKRSIKSIGSSLVKGGRGTNNKE